ncbi:acetyl-CoA carboxylase biotin carboxyl carrier protein subunit [uncultured Algibacter sp.]|uniref:acetyl-CoA carboxylase biotin carboxyl carrier protein subunit n=1 Tax=uncultured Algibacter sp. TaxID=298659 RepID=UPI002627CF12|nr:acetyl-CoA carboxylase biotin carboxyl carrier protein subunit [uncultured Algibacter sp.]
MNSHFKVKVNNSFDYTVKETDLKSLDIIPVSSTKSHVLNNDRSYSIEFVNRDFQNKSYQIKINNNLYSVNIQNQLDQLIEVMGFASGSVKQISAIKAPMPGLILDINVKVGQKVKENDALLILEAMKMENMITSPRDGIIKSLKVKQGEAVEKSQLLIEFE